MKRILQIVLIVCISSALFAEPLQLMQSIPQFALSSSTDSLKIRHPEILKVQTAPKHRIGITRQGLLGFGVMTVFSALSWHYHSEADAAYRKYQHSGNIDDMNRLYDKAVKYDKLSGWSFVGFEVGFLITLLSFNR
ncbi:MAG TPA: hypothetical protein DHW42_07425 [Candidatus Marinimicrobia bacterium]|nr:hypothetical protein [Candidatus Neomarinimicrobiota bacterium]